MRILGGKDYYDNMIQFQFKFDLVRHVIDTRLEESKIRSQRSERGRIITFASLIMLDQYMLVDLYDCDEDELPSVHGGDDAEKAFWLPLKDLNSRRAEFFEDHYHMINYFVRKAIY